MNAVGDASIVAAHARGVPEVDPGICQGEFRGKPNGHKPSGPERLTRTQPHLRAPELVS
jgi:hypothetical protein